MRGEFRRHQHQSQQICCKLVDETNCDQARYPALKRVLRSYGKVPKLPSVPVPPKQGANSNTQPGKSEPAGAATPAPVRSGLPTTLNTISKQPSTSELTKPPIKPLGLRGTTPLDPDDTQAQPPTKNQSKTAQPVTYRGGSGENTGRLTDQRPNGRQA